MLLTCKNFTGGTSKDGQSVVTFLAVDGVTNKTKMFTVVVRSAEDPENEDLTAANCNIVVIASSVNYI